jgi:hypothetical protein
MLGCGNSRLSEEVVQYPEYTDLLLMRPQSDVGRWLQGHRQYRCESEMRLLWRNLLKSDKYSPVVIEQMRQRHASTCPEMECKCMDLQRGHRLNMIPGHEMDVRDLKLDDSMFDVAIDKGLFRSEAQLPSSLMQYQAQWMQ